MEQQLPLAQKAASVFVARLRSGDRAQIIDFDRRVQVLQSFTGDRDALARTIWSVQHGWRSISVRVSRPNLQVRTRTGYDFTPHAAPVDR